MSEEKKYYVYVHRYASGPKEGQVFYVGKGSGGRCSDRQGRNIHWKRIVEKYGFSHSIVLLIGNEECAFSFEKAVIGFFGKKNLCNMTDGGDGVLGLRHSRETREKMSKAKKGWSPPPKSIETRSKIAEIHKVKIVSSLGEKFNSGIDAVNYLKLNGHPTASRGNISSCINGKQRTAYGRSWARQTDGIPVVKPKKTPNAKMVLRSDGKVFNTATEAAIYMSFNLSVNASQGNISMVCRGERPSAYGFGWSYKDE